MNRKIINNFVDFVRTIYRTNDFIPLHAPRFDRKEKEYVLNSLETTFVSSIGSYVDEFEHRISEFTGSKYTIATVNGTSALHVALILAGVRSGDEVITQSLSFVATGNAISYCGADPIFVDVELETLGMSPETLETYLDENTELRNDGNCWNLANNRIVRACVPVHDLGHPVRIKEIAEICNKYNIVLIEDAAESLGSFRGDVHTGRTGSMGILSFNGNKIITTGGGGAMITDDSNLAERAKHITTTAKVPHPWRFIHDEVGFNYRLPSLSAGVGCAQISKLTHYLDCKRILASKYRKWFENTDAVFISEPSGSRSNYWLNSILLAGENEKNEFLRYTNDCGVMTRPIWVPLHTLPMYKDCSRGDMTNTVNIESRLVSIPSSVI